MKKIIPIGLLVVILAGFTPAPAQAGAAVSVALGLASFAVFNQLAFGLFAPPVWAGGYYGGGYYGYGAAPYYGGYYGAYYPTVAYAPPAVTYYAPPVAYAQPAPAAALAPVQNQIVYPQGRYVLRGDGVTTAYQWVWIPNPPPAPTAPPTR
jgi:hypothetical protein